MAALRVHLSRCELAAGATGRKEVLRGVRGIRIESIGLAHVMLVVIHVHLDVVLATVATRHLFVLARYVGPDSSPKHAA